MFSNKFGISLEEREHWVTSSSLKDNNICIKRSEIIFDEFQKMDIYRKWIWMRSYEHIQYEPLDYIVSLRINTVPLNLALNFLTSEIVLL